MLSLEILTVIMLGVVMLSIAAHLRMVVTGFVTFQTVFNKMSPDKMLWRQIIKCISRKNDSFRWCYVTNIANNTKKKTFCPAFLRLRCDLGPLL